jgi:DNA-binding SARP family transcriptional activator
LRCFAENVTLLGVGLTIKLAGPVEIDVDGQPLKVDTKKAIALLAYLVLASGPQSREHLVDLLWPDYDEERGRATLRRTLSALKAGLGEGWIEVDRTRVGIVHDGIAVDINTLRELRGLHEHAEGESCEDCYDTLTRVVALRRGDFMEGFALRDAPAFEEWQLAQNEQLRREVGAALDQLVDAAIALERYAEARAAAESRLELDRLNEPTYRALMRIHAARGERGRVVAAYRSLVAALDRELGVEPLEETTELYRALSRGSTPAPTPLKAIRSDAADDLPFVGRITEWDRVVTTYRDRGSIFIGIEGEPGIGKTRFVEEFVAHASSLGARTVVARSHEGESNIAYGVLTEALRELVTSRVAFRLPEGAAEELARVLPELEAEAADSPVASRFYDAVRSAFEEGARGEHSGVVVFEDIHWADAATLEVLAFVSRRVAETGICLVCTWRREEVRNPELMQRIVDVPASISLTFGRFGRDELSELLSDIELPASSSPLDETIARLLAETEGVPYFVTEYVKSLRAGGSWDVPTSVRELVAHRLRSARGVAAQILDAAAVIDRAVDFDLLARVSGRTDLETADALDDLATSGLMRAADLQSARYEFSHEKLRTVAYEQMSPARRHVLHKRTADALIETGVDRDGRSAASIAHHLEHAGVNDRAADYHRRAGIWARSVFAHNEALEHFRKALALGDVSAELHEHIADIHVLQGRYAEAITSYETAAALADQPEVIDRKLGSLYLRRGEYDLAAAHLNDALTRSKNDATTTEILVDLSLAARRKGADSEAMTHAAAAVERAAALDDPVLRARAENAAGMLASARGDVTGARAHLQRAFDMATVADDLPAMIASLNNLALVERRENNTDEAIELTQQALAACRRFGDRHREAALENNLADLFHDKGDRDAAMEHLKRATAIFAEIGSDPQGPLPEVWKLVEW